MKHLSLFLCIAVFIGCSDISYPEAEYAVTKSLIENNKLGITSKDLKSKKNNKGEGVFVYVSKTKFNNTDRKIIWLVYNGIPYPLNSPTNMISKKLVWPRESDFDWEAKTGYSPYSATEAISYIF